MCLLYAPCQPGGLRDEKNGSLSPSRPQHGNPSGRGGPKPPDLLLDTEAKLCPSCPETLGKCLDFPIPRFSICEMRIVTDPLDKAFVVFFFLFFFWLHSSGCRIIVSRSGTEPTSPAVKAWSLNHWTAREFPRATTVNELIVGIIPFLHVL